MSIVFAPTLAPALNTAPLVSTVNDSAQQPKLELLRVLHVINGEHFSGAERVQQLLGQQLPNMGVAPHFACIKPGKFLRLSGLEPQRVSELPMRGRFDARIVATLHKLVRQQQIELLHAHTPRTALVTSLLALRSGLPWIYHVHSPAARDSTRGWTNRFNHWVERCALHGCHQLITVSRSLRRDTLRAGIPRQKIAVVPNGVPACEPIQGLSRIDQTSWRFGLIALMRPRKGVEVALEAMRDLKSRQLPVTLDLIGSFETEDYQQRIRQLMDQWQLHDCVHIRGFTRDVPAAIRELDALLLPSLFGEGMPMVVLEALAAGVPVIATRVEGTPEVVRDGVEGYLAQPGSSCDLANNMARLASDRTRWIALSAQALHRHRSTFSDQSMAERTAKIYRRLLNRFTNNPPTTAVH